MPMFQDHLDEDLPTSGVPGGSSQPIRIQIPSPSPPLARKLSEESIRTELCDGPVPDSPAPRTPERDISTATSDRAELIERLKRGESPTWIPNRHVSHPRPADRLSKSDHFSQTTQLESLFHRNGSLSPSRSPRPRSENSPTLLPAATITSDSPDAKEGQKTGDERLEEGLNIERPRSALHSGDFTHNEAARETVPSEERDRERDTAGYRPVSHSWLATSPPRDFTPYHFERRQKGAIPRSDDVRSALSSLSSSLSSSFVYKPPTSPLVQSESNDDLDLSLPMNNIDITSSSPSRNARRHTLNFSQQPYYSPAGLQRTPSLQREAAYPYQAHQPRRSLTSTPNFSPLGSSPQTPAFLRSRRPSYSSDVSPIQHASMVGSYEESILRGRMSTTPSKPLEFLAQIGVLGLGKCKASLRCPAHVTLPFSAVFYSYANTPQSRSKSDDGPSPYVGQIDLENGLSNQEEDARTKRKMQNRYPERRPTDEDIDMIGLPSQTSTVDARKAARQRRQSSSPRAPPGGSYRIPEKGQLQIIIKNQNKTAVKLFLIPYDLAGMEPGTKTFIRQRSYSAGPIIDNLPSLHDASADRQILRYLIHLHICCPARGRYYLYKSIRVVFANRVPDGKEKLRNEVTFPEPRFTAYKPIRVMHPPISLATTGPGAMLTAEKAYRRRSSGFSFGGRLDQNFDAEPPMPPFSMHSRSSSTSHQGSSSSAAFSFAGSGAGAGHNTPVDPVPFRLPAARKPPSDVSEGSETTATQLQSPTSSRASRPSTQGSADGAAGVPAAAWQGLDGIDRRIARYDKLSKGDIGYGGNAFAQVASGSPGTTEGLLSQRLRSLGVQGQGQETGHGQGQQDGASDGRNGADGVGE